MLPAVALASPEPDPHVRWAREWQALDDRLNTPGLVADEDASEVFDEQLRFEGLIAETPARTLAGVREQVAIVVRVMRHSTPAEVDRVALENAIATLERLAGEARHG